MSKNISNGVVHTLPLDLKKAITSNKKVLAAWESLTPLARNEWICWVVSVTLDETRQNHVKRAVTELKQGKRRPCCWYGCIHRKDKKVSPSVRNIVLNRKKTGKTTS